ncbi:thioredoxin fold domain-containing protein [Thermocrinis sp.]|uniref:thioredoxin family protein n=1 Tax=Thermocrinis sp. TaxID=2024383 RepID=UPI002FDD06C7
MKVALTVLTLWAIFILSCQSKGNNTSSEVKDLIPKSNYAMLVVESENCIYCKQLDKDLKNNPTLKSAVEGIDVLRLLAESNAKVRYRIDGKEGETTEEELARMLNVRAYPHIIFYDSKGEIVLRIPGYAPPKTLACVVEYVKNELYNKEELNQYLKRENCI